MFFVMRKKRWAEFTSNFTQLFLISERLIDIVKPEQKSVMGLNGEKFEVYGSIEFKEIL